MTRRILITPASTVSHLVDQAATADFPPHTGALSTLCGIPALESELVDVTKHPLEYIKCVRCEFLDSNVPLPSQPPPPPVDRARLDEIIKNLEWAVIGFSEDPRSANFHEAESIVRHSLTRLKEL